MGMGLANANNASAIVVNAGTMNTTAKHNGNSIMASGNPASMNNLNTQRGVGGVGVPFHNVTYFHAALEMMARSM